MNYEKPRAFGGSVPLAEKNPTPNLAGQGKPLSRLSGSNVVNGSPSPRTDARPYSAGGNGVTKENMATPVKNISSNVTPRSGSRKVRAENASPTIFVPSDCTPTTSRPQSSIEKRDRNSIDFKVLNGFEVQGPPNGRSSRSESLISDGPGSSYPSRPALIERNNSSNSSNGITSPKGPAMFFHANDVQATVSSKQPTEKAVPQPRIQGWVNTTEGGASVRTLAMSNNSIPDEQSSKFFYANDPKQSKSPPPRLPNGTTANRPPLQTIYSAQAPTSPQRAPSPLKEELIPPAPRKSSISKASPRRHTRLVSNSGSETKASEAVKTDLSRRSSINSRTGTRTSTSHVRSPSVQSTGGSPVRRNSTVGLEISPIEPIKRESTAGANGAFSHNVNPSPPSLSQDYTGSLSPSLPQSPTKPQSKLDQMNELAANARRERKVLDLEISNSSLLAINRTLEREMRKQNAELRRYRRLSRSGRLSVAPTSHSSRKSKLSETDTAMDSGDLFPSSDSEDEHDEDFLSTKLSDSETSDSPAARAARARFQDAERPSLDLSVHRLLLLESQKMNQSIKRCLSHSDALIAAGRQALEHQAEAPEPENLGPKVLTPEEYDDTSIERSQGLLSPGLGPPGLSRNPWERSLAQIGGLDGGLETPDYSKWGSEVEPELPVFHPEDNFDDAKPTGMPIADDAWSGAAEEETSSSPLVESSSPLEWKSEPKSHNPTISPPALPSHQSSDEEISFQASLDGLDSGHSTPSPAAGPVLNPERERAGAEDGSRPPSPSRPPPTTNAAANTPGNRSSIQNFGTYLGLQSLNIFGQTGG